MSRYTFLAFVIFLSACRVQAQTNDTKDLPKNHWVYAVCRRLVQAHLIEPLEPDICFPTAKGYKYDQSHRLFTRYEFAIFAIRAKQQMDKHPERDSNLSATQWKALRKDIARLQKEFHTEIKTLSRN